MEKCNSIPGSCVKQLSFLFNTRNLNL
uniref:Uncharacterized protein n=1 Tax=Arundo donax TaxID=35708 RepID=A0A0A8YHW1_ARUDO